MLRNSEAEQRLEDIIVPIITGTIDGATEKSATATTNDDTCHAQDNIRNRLVSLSRPERFKINKNSMVIWVDPNMNISDEDHLKAVAELRRIFNRVEIFPDFSECVHCLTRIDGQNVFVILSGDLDEFSFSLIHQAPQLDSIYVLSNRQVDKEDWTPKWTKMKGIFKRMEDVCDTIKDNIRQSDVSLTPISILGPPSITDSTELDQSFMYSQLVKEILLEMAYDKRAHKDFADFCRLYYRGNECTMRAIDEFQHNYNYYSPIWWYTKESFLYSMLNRALRTQDIETIIKIAFFICDMHREILKVGSSEVQTTPMIIYRGQGMIQAEFEKLKQNKDGLLAFNSFLSTSVDRQVSLAFAESARGNPELVGILFRIEVDTSIASISFASLDNISYFSTSEKEILFSMHSVFRIGEINQIDDRLWQVTITATGDTDQQLALLTEYIRKETEGSTGLHRLGLLMGVMGEFDKAEEVYKSLLKTASDGDWQQYAFLYGQLGQVNLQKGDLTSAFSHVKKSVEIYLMHLPSDSPQLSSNYCNMGAILKEQGDLDGALNYYQRALDIDLRDPNADPLNIATQYNNIGSVRIYQRNYTEALESFERTLEIFLAHLPPLHPLLASTYNNIGAAHAFLKNYLSALSYRRKALEIMERSLPTNSPSLAGVHSNIAGTLASLHRYEEGVEHASRAFTIAYQAFGLNHSDVVLYQDQLDTVRQKL